MTPRNQSVVITISLVVAGIAVAEGVLTLVQRWFSARIGEGLIFDLRTEVFPTSCASPSRSSRAPRPERWSAA